MRRCSLLFTQAIKKMENRVINGSDLLVRYDNYDVAYCTSHTVTFNSEAKARAVKPISELTKSDEAWKDQGVTALSVSINFEGLRTVADFRFDLLLQKFSKGTAFNIEAFQRGESIPYMYGDFVLTSLEETAAALEDVVYKGTFESCAKFIYNYGRFDHL